FGVTSGNASVNYFHSQHINSNTLYVVLNVKVTNTAEVMDHLELTTDAYKMLEDGDLARFMDACGDSFIAGRTTGGEFSAVIKIESESESERNTLESSLSAGGFNWSTNVKTQSKMTEAVSHHKLTYEFFKKGGIG